MEKFNCKTANQIDLVHYLETLGHEPSKIRNQDYWYLSPLRNENTPSFKVNQKLNVWYDHGIGSGGRTVDFGVAYFRCSVSEFLELLNSGISSAVSFHVKNENQQSLNQNFAIGQDTSDKIIITAVRELENKSLLHYLKNRGIPEELAKEHCKEIDFSLRDRKQAAIGFNNISGGYELRNDYFKGSSSPKDITFIDKQEKSIAVFEGFFDYLSFMAINKKEESNYLILNSLSFFSKSLQLMDKYEKINLYLDRDAAGVKCTRQAIERLPSKYTDQSFLYDQKKDLNQWLNEPKQIKKSPNFRRSI